MYEYLREIAYLSLGSSPEEMLKASLEACIHLSDASGGSILGEEGPYLQFLFSDVSDLIGERVPFDSIAGVTVIEGLVVYTYAPADKRHFEDVDRKIKHLTRYLLSIPVPAVHSSAGEGKKDGSSGALQLLFEKDVLPELEVGGGPVEMPPEELRKYEVYESRLKEIMSLLPLVALGMEVLRLRETSYQAIHELKNKLISAYSWLDYLRDDIRDREPSLVENEDISEDFEICTSSVREGAELAEKYLQFTKIYNPEFRDQDMNTLVRETADSASTLGARMAIPGLRVDCRPAPEACVRKIDAAQLKMALFNLCKNAVEVLAEQGVESPCLSISCGVRDGFSEVVIKDNGPGMPREIADQLFVPFKTKKEGGTGLGLAITKKIVDIHGGRIVCETGNDGTAFKITI
ncbi:MAG: HAMP domain-containing sensor histidine kinase [Kiritimatiellia bacterium]